MRQRADELLLPYFEQGGVHPGDLQRGQKEPRRDQPERKRRRKEKKDKKRAASPTEGREKKATRTKAPESTGKVAVKTGTPVAVRNSQGTPITPNVATAKAADLAKANPVAVPKKPEPPKGPPPKAAGSGASAVGTGPTQVTFSQTKGGLATLGLWDAKAVPKQHHVPAGEPPTGENIKSVSYRGQKDEVNLPSRQVWHQMHQRGPMAKDAKEKGKGKGKGKEKGGKNQKPLPKPKGKGGGKVPTAPKGPPPSKPKADQAADVQKAKPMASEPKAKEVAKRPPAKVEEGTKESPKAKEVAKAPPAETEAGTKESPKAAPKAQVLCEIPRLG